jgi:N4-gp56 family major capsid protein
MSYQTLGAGGLTVEDQLATFSKRLLSRFRAKATFARYGMKNGIPTNGGRGISFRGLTSIYPAGAAGSTAAGSAPSVLTEGTPGAAIDATWRQIVATVNQFGQYLQVTDVAELQALDSLVPNYVEAFGESMTDAIDLVTRDILVAGTNVQYASIATTRGGASGLGSGMYLSLAELRKAKKTLMRNNVNPHSSEGGKYMVITSPEALYDLEGDSNITNFWQYAGDRGVSGNQLFDTAFRDLPMGFRLVTTTNTRNFVDAGLSTADVHATLVFGEEWFGTLGYDAMPAQVIVKDRGSAGTSDPLNQVATVGWKAAHAAVILNQANGVRIEHVTSTNNMG